MAIQANEPHVHTVQAYQALQAHPELQPYMKQELRERLEKQALLVAPLLQLTQSTDDKDNDALGAADVALQNSRQLIVWVHEGARFRYRNHPEELAKLAPVRVGRDAAEDEVRLVTLERELPKLKPAFPWIPEEGLTLEAVTKQLKAHREAMQVESSLGAKEREALKALRELRPESRALWDDEGGLDAWVQAMVPKELQHAFGRERKQKPRSQKPAAAPAEASEQKQA